MEAEAVPSAPVASKTPVQNQLKEQGSSMRPAPAKTVGNFIAAYCVTVMAIQIFAKSTGSAAPADRSASSLDPEQDFF